MNELEMTRPVMEPPVFDFADIDIPYTAFTLPNGLRLIVHEDHKAPIVAINVWYHVGSKNEKPGKSGYAHLFEHLMFNGSEHFNQDYFQALLGIGATDLNGTTSQDRTNYFQNVPTAALDQVLWLESDRMGHLLGALDQAKLDEQRGVVINEKKQRENVPYGSEQEIILAEMFPKGHPYSWTVIGSMEDLEAATLEDFREWFRSYYGAANAVLVIAGDVQAEDVHKRVLKYFGDIAPGPPITRPVVNIPARENDSRTVFQDRVPEAKITLVWNTPELGSREDALLSLASDVLSNGKNARLYKPLVYEEKIATRVSAMQWSKEIAGNFVVSVAIKPGEQIETVERRLNEILSDFLATGPTQQELDRVRAQYVAGFIKGMERIGGFGGKSDILASSTIYGGSPDAYKQYLGYLAEASVDDVLRASRRWLSKGKFTLICEPLPDLQAQSEGADRTALPELEEVRAGVFPEVQRARLANGLEIVLAQREESPTVIVEAVFDVGCADDHIPGLATMAMSMLDEGTENMTSLEISEYLQCIGASVQCMASLDHVYVRLSALKQSLRQGLNVFWDIVTRPTFPEKEFERLKKEQLSAIQREKMNPMPMAMRVLPRLLFGKDHRYSNPFTGSGFEHSIERLSLSDVQGFYDAWIRPNNARIVIVGNVSMDEAKELLAPAMENWDPKPVPGRLAAQESGHRRNVVYMLDRPGALQSIVIGGYLIEAHEEPTAIAEEHMNDVLGGQFISRINLNLREDKHWTYGARSVILDTLGQRPLLAYSSVQLDKTLESIREIQKEFEALVGDRPISAAEFEKNRTNAVLGLPGQWETNAAVADSLLLLLRHNLADDYFRRFPGMLQALQIEEVHTVSQSLIRPESLVWVVVGDRAKVLPMLQGQGFAEVIDIDSEGNPLVQPAA